MVFPLKVANIIGIILYAFIFVACFLNIVSPQWVWEKFESWKATKEPTDLYFKVRRISSIVMLAVISIVFFAPTIIALCNR